MEGQNGPTAENQNNPRGAKENFNGKVYIKEGHLLPKETLENIKENISSFDKDFLQEAQEKSFSVMEVLGETGKEKLDRTYEAVRENLKRRGIQDINFPPTVFLEKKEGGVTGQAYTSHVEVENFEKINMPLLKEIETLRIVAHELYHSSGVNVLTLYKDGAGDIVTSSITKGGASHRNFYNKYHNMALEEGAAIIFEREILEELFSDNDLQSYDDFISKFAIDEKHKAIDGSRPRLSVLEYDNETSNTMFGINIDYKNSELLVNYIKSRISNFDEILEQSRIHLKTLDLVRSIEKEFGQGMYRKISTCIVADAGDLLDTLKGIETLKQNLLKNAREWSY